jgi:hypothetical protein
MRSNNVRLSTGYLKWVFGAQGFSDYSMAVFNKNELAGVFLHTPRKIILSSRQMQTGIQSALSIQPEHKGKGLAKYLHLKTQEALQKGSLDGQVLWYDCTVKTKHKSSHDIFQNLEGAYFEHLGNYPLKIKVFDYKRAFRVSNLNIFEQLGMKLLTKVPGPDPSIKIEEIDENNFEEVHDFLNKESIKKGFGRLFSLTEFYNYSGLNNSKKNKDFKIQTVLTRISGNIQGACVGYPIEIISKNRDNIFFIDLFVTTSVIDYKKFLNAAEFFAYKNTNCFGLITPLRQLGVWLNYIPSGKSLSCCYIPFKKTLKHYSIPKNVSMVIDHK